jgi:hypothetical protein
MHDGIGLPELAKRVIPAPGCPHGIYGLAKIVQINLVERTTRIRRRRHINVQHIVAVFHKILADSDPGLAATTGHYDIFHFVLSGYCSPDGLGSGRNRLLPE